MSTKVRTQPDGSPCRAMFIESFFIHEKRGSCRNYFVFSDMFSTEGLSTLILIGLSFSFKNLLKACTLGLNLFRSRFFATCRNFCEDIEDECECRQVDADPLSAKPLPQVLWHRVHARGHVHGDKHPAQEKDEKHRLQMREGVSEREERLVM